MTFTICYALIFLAEILISLFYFENKFERKASKRLLMIFLIAVYIILYASRLLNFTWANLIAFWVCNFFLLYCCYHISIKASVFHCSILLILNVLTESIVMFASSAILGTDLLACLDNSLNLIFQSTISKLLYFFTIYLISKISSKEHRRENGAISITLFILPVSSALIIYSVLYALAEYDIKQAFLSILAIGIVLLLFSNLIVFWIYELTLKTNRRNMELEIEQQKEKATAEYYELLNRQNENSKILIHDIKRHLNAIKGITQNQESVNEYIDNIIEDFSINKTVEYCNNPMVNVIVNRYKTLCDSYDIKMNIDIRTARLDFMSEPDITALLDNILENAAEAAKKAENKFIDFSMFMRKNKYISILVTNSVSNKVYVVTNRITSSKKSGGIHGTGLKSIRRVIKKYNGEINMKFNSEEMTFTSNIVFQLL